MPPGSPTCTIRSTSFIFYSIQRGQYRFRVGAQENNKLPKRSTIFSKTKRARATLSSPDRIEVTVHTAFEQHTTTRTIMMTRTIARMGRCMKIRTQGVSVTTWSLSAVCRTRSLSTRNRSSGTTTSRCTSGHFVRLSCSRDLISIGKRLENVRIARIGD
jgi:hypothetical protein